MKGCGQVRQGRVTFVISPLVSPPSRPLYREGLLDDRHVELDVAMLQPNEADLTAAMVNMFERLRGAGKGGGGGGAAGAMHLGRSGQKLRMQAGGGGVLGEGRGAWSRCSKRGLPSHPLRSAHKPGCACGARAGARGAQHAAGAGE
jgi:hypothetical protein